MIFCIQGVLSADERAEVRNTLAGASFIDGRKTAGWHARFAKHNQQAADSGLAEVTELVSGKLLANEVFRLAARPKRLSPLLFSRYTEGMHYGTHVDDAVMNGLRSDLSFTVFLSDPGEYEGGELVLERTDAEQPVKLNAGDAVLYPSTTLHRVETVTRGTRLAAVGWLQSLVRRADERELLFDLDTARLALFRREGRTAEFELLSKCLSNLLRLWVEP